MNVFSTVLAAMAAWMGASAGAQAQPAPDVAIPPDPQIESPAITMRDSPVLVELFTSQGCPMCPQANAYLGVLDEARDDVLVLAYAVSYWDMYGWTDTYARPEYVQRQRTYLPRLGLNRPFTPHFVLDGAADARGWSPDKVEGRVDEMAALMSERLDVVIADDPWGARKISVSGGEDGMAMDVWLAAYAPGWAEVRIEAGENAGIDMPHYNMVKSLSYLGRYEGGEAEYMGESFDRYGVVVIVQDADGGPVRGLAHAEARSRARDHEGGPH